MKLVTALQWVNGAVLMMALSVCVVVGVLQWLGRFAKGAAQTAWETSKLFASGFQHTPQRAADPFVDLSLLATGVVFFGLLVSLFLARYVNVLHGCAALAGALLVWNLRPGQFGPWTCGVLLLWGLYYWAAAWRSA